MRRLVAFVTAVVAIALIVLSLRTLSTAMERDGSQLMLPMFASSIHPPSIIAGTVFDDTDANGSQDAGESGIAGVTVNLLNSEVDATTTGPDGDYSFTVGWADDYTVTTVAPPGYASTTAESVVAAVNNPGELVEVNFGYRTFSIHMPLIARNRPSDH